jgi:hypothetical protein
MMFTAVSSLLVVMTMTAATAAAAPTKIDFLRAMDKHRNGGSRRLSESEFKAELYGNSPSSSALRAKFMEKSTLINSDEQRRQLQNYKYDANHDGSDDYFRAFGTWENEFGFDITQYSLSYHRCSEVRQFDDELAAQEDSTNVFATKHFAVFRFCPKATCMGWQEEEADCGCYYQCQSVLATEASNGNNNGDSDLCESACQTQCVIWQRQNQDSSSSSSGSGRNLQNNNNNNNAYDSYTFAPYYDDGSSQEVYGARGQGCQANYGEYMIEIQDYLQMMLEWQEERYEEYETYCENCMLKVYNQWLKNGGQRERHLSFEEFKNSEEHRSLGGYYGACPEYDTCSGYMKLSFVDKYSGYFECTEVEHSNGQVAYIGPHCAADGFTITLGVFSDQYCNEYIGNGVDISNFLGGNLAEDALKGYYNTGYGATFEQLKYIQDDNLCIPCMKSEHLWTTDDGGDASDITELCAYLYESSARCDKHYRAYNSQAQMAKYAEAVAQEDLACDFIDSVVMGNFNEMGFVNLDNMYGIQNGDGSTIGQQYGKFVGKVSPLQIFGLVASLMAVVILAGWSMTLHQSLTKNGPWRPRRRADLVNANSLDRQNSGIVLGRSMSNTSYYVS